MAETGPRSKGDPVATVDKIETITTPISLEYTYTAGSASTRGYSAVCTVRVPLWI